MLTGKGNTTSKLYNPGTLSEFTLGARLVEGASALLTVSECEKALKTIVDGCQPTLAQPDTVTSSSYGGTYTVSLAADTVVEWSIAVAELRVSPEPLNRPETVARPETPAKPDTLVS